MQLNSRQAGFSLLELMVAMALGTFIIAGLLSVFIASSKGYAAQQALVEVQDKGRFAMEKLREDIQRAGHGLDADSDPVRFVAMGGATDCDNSVDVLEVYYQEADDDMLRCYYLDANGALRRNQTEVNTAVNNAEAVTIIDAVDQIEFLFAVDVDANSSVDVIAGNLYQTGVGLPAVANWNDVIAVRIELIVASNTERVVDDAQILANPFDRVPAVPFQAADDDSSLHKAYIGLIALRSRLL